MGQVTVYLGLGSNLGRREENLSEAICLLGGTGRPTVGGAADGPEADGASIDEFWIIRVSSVYETSPWGYKDQPDFLNCVLEAYTSLSPEKLLERVQAVEQSVGRQPSVRFGPRHIDVDILFYGDDIVEQPNLQIPHPRLHQRAFVLIPLAEVQPALVHPLLKTSIGGLAVRVDGREGVNLWGPLLTKAG